MHINGKELFIITIAVASKIGKLPENRSYKRTAILGITDFVDLIATQTDQQQT